MTKILVVDDEPNVLKCVEYMLEPEGYEVITARGGEECLKLLESVRPDYIFLDVMMPNMDGWEVLRRIKSNRKLRDIPVSMLTVIPLNKDAIEKEEGVKRLTDYVTKPFSKQDLIAVLNQVL